MRVYLLSWTETPFYQVVAVESVQELRFHESDLPTHRNNLTSAS